jgi:hypothetical protein
MASLANNGRPSKPIRLMVGLLLLKQLENLSDERVVLQCQLVKAIDNLNGKFGIGGIGDILKKDNFVKKLCSREWIGYLSLTPIAKH